MTKELTVQLILKQYDSSLLIETIINNINKLDIKMYDHISGERYFKSPLLENESAVKRLKRKAEETSILCRKSDISFFLFCIYENNQNQLCLLSTGYPLKKEFLNGDQTVEFDLQRYLRLMLDMTKGLKINKIEAKIEWE